jgi:hypothetical protein
MSVEYYRLLASVALCITTSAIFLPSSLIADEGPLRAGDFVFQRPANFYALTFDDKRDVCEPILDSLNQPYAAQTRGEDNTTGPLMHNAFLMNVWREKRYDPGIPDSTGQPFMKKADQALVDINNDGREDAIYREDSMVSSVLFHLVLLSLSPREDELSTKVLSAERYREIVGPVSSSDKISSNLLLISPNTVDPTGRENAINHEYYVDILEIADKRYLIASRAIFWKPTAVTILLEVTDSRHLRLVCQFTGKHNLTE